MTPRSKYFIFSHNFIFQKVDFIGLGWLSHEAHPLLVPSQRTVRYCRKKGKNVVVTDVTKGIDVIAIRVERFFWQFFRFSPG